MPAKFSLALLCFLTTCWTISAQKPQLFVQLAQPSVGAIKFSSDGKLLAVADNTGVKLWDVGTGQELRALPILSSTWMFTDNENIISDDDVGGDRQSTKIVSWSVNDGSKSVAGSGPRETKLVSISANGALGVNCGGAEDDQARIWNVRTGAVIRSIHTRCDEVEMSSDGKAVLTIGEDNNPWARNEQKTVSIWDANTGASLFVRDNVKFYAFSSDNKTLAVAQDDHSPIVLLNAVTGVQIRTFDNPKGFASVVLSRDGSTLTAANENTVRVWDVKTGAVRTEIKTFASNSSLNRDGSLLAIVGGTTAVRRYSSVAIYDSHTGKKAYDLGAQAESPSCLAFSADGRMLAGGAGGSTIKIWNLTSGEALRTLRHSSNAVNSIAFSEDGNNLFSGGSEVKLWSLNGPKVLSLRGFTDIISVLAPSHDGRTLATKGTDDNNIDLYDTDNGNKRLTLTGHTKFVTSIAFTPDDQKLISSSADDTIRIWNTASGSQLREIKAMMGTVYAIALNPKGRLVAAGGLSNRVKLWDLNSGALVRTLIANSADVQGVAFNPSNTTLATLGDGIVELWDANTGVKTGSFSGYMTRIVFSPDGRILATADLDGSIKLRDSRTGAELASMIAVGDRDWLVVTPDGFFDGSPAAWNKILWRFSPRLYDVAPVEAFFDEYYYPDLLADVLNGRAPHAAKAIAQRDRRQPRLELSVSDDSMAGSEVVTRLATVKIAISEAPAGAQDVRLFRNGSLVKVWHGDVMKGQARTALEAKIPVVAGTNQLVAYAFNNDNIKSRDATLEISGGENLRRKGVAYLLAIGVNQYANAQYNLKYAVADAQDFAAEFKRQQTALANYERVEVVALNDREATKEQILKALDSIAARSQPEDAVVIYFAGHGTAQQNQFFLIPHDLGYSGDRTQLDEPALNGILRHSISDHELQTALETVDAGQLLLVIDACNSGQALEADEQRRGPMNSRGLAQLAYEKGMYILTAAQSFQAAQETARLGHGFLTYSLVEEGLKTKLADRAPRDGMVMLREWLDFATERVPALQTEELEQQKRQGRQLQQLTNFGVGGAELQRPRVFYRREIEPVPFVVAKP